MNPAPLHQTPPQAAPADAFRDLPALLAEHAQRTPFALALRQDQRTLTHAQLGELIDRAAAALQRDGGAPQQVVAICATSGIDYLLVFLGALRAGLAVAPLAPGSTPAQIADMVRDCGAIRFFADAGVLDALRVGGVAIDRLPPVTRLDADFAGWLAPAGACPTAVVIQPDWAFNLIYSSGTTGTPKGIVQAHAMRWSHINRAGLIGYAANSVTLASTPLYSNTTLVAVIPTLAMGGCVILMPRFDVVRYLELAQAHRVTHSMLVPVQYQRLMSHPDFDRYDLSSFIAKLSTSAPFHAALKADVLARWPGALIEYYGMTEGGGTCILQAHLHPDKLHTVGQPAEGHDIRLIDEQGREVAPGEAGEVVGRSAGMMLGYHKQPAKTAEAEWYDASGQRFIRTGDVGRFDADGFLILFDRRKDMVISGGFNIYPSDLEAVLRRHPDVVDAAVIGVPSVEWGETPVALVVTGSGAHIEPEPLRQWVNQQVGKTQRLTALRFIDELPRSAIGKVLKRELRDAWRD